MEGVKFWVEALKFRLGLVRIKGGRQTGGHKELDGKGLNQPWALRSIRGTQIEVPRKEDIWGRHGCSCFSTSPVVLWVQGLVE